MLLRDILPALEAIAPLRYAEPWDNVGLIVGDPAADVGRVLLTIDCTPAVADEARRKGCELVVAYHPPLFEAVKRIHADSLLHRAIRDGMSLYSPHTALDVAPGGTNDVLSDIVGMVERGPLKPSLVTDDAARGARGPGGMGIGRIGTLAGAVPRGLLIARIKEELELRALLLAGPLEGSVTRVAVCAGAGGSLLDLAIAQKAELYLTGEMRHHDALKAASAGMTVVCALHSNSERVTLGRVKARLEAALAGVLVMRSEEDRDPFVVG